MIALPRNVCPTCRRPAVVCYCAHLLQIPTRTRLVFLQHPREARVPIGTARMAHLMLPNSELHRGVSFANHPPVAALLADPGAALLYPGPDALDPTALLPGTITTLVVVDGTWAQARKVLRENPALRGLPRLGLVPARPGNYRIRREPAPECLATVEAVSQILAVLEGDGKRFDAMLSAFTFMVDEQIARAAERGGTSRRMKAARKQEALAAAQKGQLHRAVAVHCEVNSHAKDSPAPGRPELLHLVAWRLADGERLSILVAPRRPLGPRVAPRLEVSAERLISGATIDEAMERWRAFLRPGDVLCGWGCFARDQLLAEGAAVEDWLDLRTVLARRLQRSPGGPTDAARALGLCEALPTATGRAGRMVERIGQIASALDRS